ncbi:hypothetical protein NW768_009584 [Fusarium equiseti]|uniref:Uncharacterized protein n=1 Tax=Fusarium equiseti TaxID=61235 RepID=A0ABQ8R300_FUSEQ|nr:hypothetical protein NW768_009584 [Fusarium equiseti]
MEEIEEQPPDSGKISPEECSKWWDSRGFLQKYKNRLWLASLITYAWFYFFLKMNILLPVSPATKRPNSWGWWWLTPIALIELSTCIAAMTYLIRTNSGAKESSSTDAEYTRTRRVELARDTFVTAMNDVLTYLYFGATSLMSVPEVPKRQILVIAIFGLSGVVATVLAGFRA